MVSVTRLVPKSAGGPPRDPADDHWLRRQALTIVAQLPEENERALCVLEHARTLVNGYLG